jgi:hypothetical protein
VRHLDRPRRRSSLRQQPSTQFRPGERGYRSRSGGCASARPPHRARLPLRTSLPLRFLHFTDRRIRAGLGASAKTNLFGVQMRPARDAERAVLGSFPTEPARCLTGMSSSIPGRRFSGRAPSHRRTGLGFCSLSRETRTGGIKIRSCKGRDPQRPLQLGKIRPNSRRKTGISAVFPLFKAGSPSSAAASF